jgi:cyclic pyranopterin phosphate synthase
MDAWQPPQTAPPSEGPLVDTFGRVADDLRISVTDRCNFRCVFCMPAEGLKWLPKDEILTFEELTRLLRIFVSLGVRSIKVTGGEPSVRADLPTLVSMFREVGPELDMSMTTNGILLDRLAEPHCPGRPRQGYGVVSLADAPPVRRDDPPRRAG